MCASSKAEGMLRQMVSSTIAILLSTSFIITRSGLPEVVLILTGIVDGGEKFARWFGKSAYTSCDGGNDCLMVAVNLFKTES